MEARDDEDATQDHRSDIQGAVDEAASDLHDAGGMAKRALRRFDALCLTPVEPLDAEAIRALSERERASQAVLARDLNVTTELVSQWERGEKRPSGASLKLLTLARLNGLAAIA